ncbi:MAG: FHA domain-containing protein [Rhodanobacteraceae bacterium]
MGDTRIKPDMLSGIDLASLDALKTLKHDADQLRSRRAALDAMKADFAEPVYRRVDADYAKQLDALERKAEPLRQQALAAYAGLRTAVKDIDSAHEAVKLDRQEIDLRHKLGEFDGAERDRRVASIEATLNETRVAHEQSQALRARFLEVFPDEAELDRATPVPPTRPASTVERARAAAAVGSMPTIEPAATRVLPILDLPDPPRPPPVAKAPPLAAATVSSAATMFLRTARLVPQSPEAGRAAIPLPPRPVTLGNDGNAEIQVGGPGVEARHAEININAKGYTLVDLGSKLGTLVNAEPVQERLLRHEDVIQIGAARYVFREG